MFPKTKKAFIIFGLITILIISYPYMQLALLGLGVFL